MELNEIDFIKDVLSIPDRYDYLHDAMEALVKNLYKDSRRTHVYFSGYRLDSHGVHATSEISRCSCCSNDTEEDFFGHAEVIEAMYSLGAFDV